MPEDRNQPLEVGADSSRLGTVETPGRAELNVLECNSSGEEV